MAGRIRAHICATLDLERRRCHFPYYGHLLLLCVFLIRVCYYRLLLLFAVLVSLSL